MRIGIDARFYGPIGKGLGRYTEKLIENLEKISAQGGPASGGDHQYFVFLKSENFNDYKPKNSNFQKIKADYHWYTFSEQFRFPRLLKKYKLDLMHFPHFNVPMLYRKKFIVTIHDLILVRFPTTRSSTLGPLLFWFKFLAYKIVIKSAMLRSEKIIAVSKFTKKDILEMYKSIPDGKIVVTYEACDDFCMSSPNKDNEILGRYGIRNPYMLYVGNVYPHKNPERLSLAFKKLAKEKIGINLVYVGAEDYFYKRLKKFCRENAIKNICFAGFVPDYDLDILFHNALAYIRPSLYEGFELPPLEAMAKGTPVLSSSHSCALEILEDSAFYFDAQNVEDIARAIRRIITDEALRKDLMEKGYRQVQKYSWKNMAKKTLSVYNSIG
jgi:glycosyltransferase involved in cell wall biosynthesis